MIGTASAGDITVAIQENVPSSYVLRGLIRRTKLEYSGPELSWMSMSWEGISAVLSGPTQFSSTGPDRPCGIVTVQVAVKG